MIEIYAVDEDGNEELTYTMDETDLGFDQADCDQSVST